MLPQNIAFFSAGKKLGRDFIIFMGTGRNTEQGGWGEREREREIPLILHEAAPDPALLG